MSLGSLPPRPPGFLRHDIASAIFPGGERKRGVLLLSRRHTRQSKPSNLRAEPLCNGRGVRVEHRVRPNPTAHRVSEGLGIPRRVASQQSPLPLPQAGRILRASWMGRQRWPPHLGFEATPFGVRDHPIWGSRPPHLGFETTPFGVRGHPIWGSRFRWES
jgi:hypothetical protein